MEGFKPFKKVQCFKEGGSVQKEVNFKKRDRKNVEPSDLAQDKKLIKKAFKQHDEAEHDKEPTEIKLKKGGRAKKDCGTVKKYKTGGVVENAYGAKKTDKDIKDIANAKSQKPAKLCGGKSVKKMADGMLTAPMSGTQQAAMQGALPGGQGMGSANDMERRRMMDRAKNAMKYLGPQQQSEFVNQGGMAPAPQPVQQPAPYKKGGKVKKYGVGGAIAKAASKALSPQLIPAGVVAPLAGIAVHSDMKNQEKIAAAEAAKNKEADAKSAPVTKKRGGKVCR